MRCTTARAWRALQSQIKTILSLLQLPPLNGFAENEAEATYPTSRKHEEEDFYSWAMKPGCDPHRERNVFMHLFSSNAGFLCLEIENSPVGFVAYNLCYDHRKPIGFVADNVGYDESDQLHSCEADS
ncbi:hypothetical protein OIU76_024224 [Salix suchowensis]|nr:hypothetical protein OIU76_024224 [Salix suchowensis]